MTSWFMPRPIAPAEGERAKGWIDQALTSRLISLSRRACLHPLHTIVVIALLGSTTYLGLLEGSTFGRSRRILDAYGVPDWRIISQDSYQLWTGPDNKWTWSSGSAPHLDAEELLLATLVFQDQGSSSFLRPEDSTVSTLLSGLSAKKQPVTLSWAPHNGDDVQAWSLLHDERDNFLRALSEVPAADPENAAHQTGNPLRRPRWLMKASDDPSTLRPKQTWRDWAQEKWQDFLEVFQKAETLDIVIMFLGYLAMHLTFVSLFLSMRSMGSNFWLAASTLISSAFGFLFAMIVTTKLGVAVNMVLLSEGLPFLVVIVGFEKPIQLTKSVLSASVELRQQPSASMSSKPCVQQAVEAAVASKGFSIVKDYALEIVILAFGAMSGVQGGLRQFCFLAAWIMFFDCIMLFTFYTSILTIKLEINRIKRHVAIRKALEEDGISRRVAESVAQDDEWPKSSNLAGNSSFPSRSTIFDRRLKDINISKFKILMVLGFIAVNVLNFCSLPFRKSNEQAQFEASNISLGVIPPIQAPDPFIFAGSALRNILTIAHQQKRPVAVTVLKPIIYELSPGLGSRPSWSDLSDSATYSQLSPWSMSGRVVQSLMRSFEDPVFSKWVILTLFLSVILNGYLFNAARWTIKETQDSGPRERRGSIWSKIGRRTSEAQVQKQTAQLQPQVNGHVPGRPLHIDTTGVDEIPVEAIAEDSEDEQPVRIRSTAECEELLKEGQAWQLNDEELIALGLRGKIPLFSFEKTLQDSARAVRVRRAVVARNQATSATTASLETCLLPHKCYDYDKVLGACCENVVGYMPLPLGVAGPLKIDGQSYFLPMATTEGVLVASTSRGCKAINAGGGATTVLTGDGMTRGPCVGFETLVRAGEAKIWLDSELGQSTMRKAFNSTSRFARLSSLKTALAGTYVYIRFKTTTGDAMGMNMISKGVEHSLHVMASEAGFNDMSIISVSGNYCTDKKPAAINWIDGRGKSVVAEAIIPKETVEKILKSNVDALVELNISKNLIGSAMAGSIGGFNAHAANIVTAIFLATGQDPAQNVESSNCITTMRNLRGDLQINVSMPSIEVGTIGGGTILPPQKAMLDLLGVSGPCDASPGENARRLARIVAAAVLAGELSLCSALAAGHLVRSHMAHNRSQPPTRSVTPVTAAMEKGPLTANGSAEEGVKSPVRLTMTSISGQQTRRLGV